MGVRGFMWFGGVGGPWKMLNLLVPVGCELELLLLLWVWLVVPCGLRVAGCDACWFSFLLFIPLVICSLRRWAVYG